MADLPKPTPASLHAMTPRELMAYVALGSSILGSAVLTIFAAVIVFIVWKGGWPDVTAPERIAILSRALVISLGGSLVVLITLGFVISRRTIRVSKDGFAMSSDGSSNDDNDGSVTDVAKVKEVSESS